jgi:RimJ/RimL family protein N-acetyltransferase
MQYFYTGPRSKIETLKNLHDYITHQETYNFSNWAVFEKNTDRFIGRAGPLIWDQPTIQLTATNPLAIKTLSETTTALGSIEFSLPNLGTLSLSKGDNMVLPNSFNSIELSYVLHQKFWGLGFATEIASQIITWIFKNLTIDQIIAVTTPENLASQKVMAKVGMQLDQYTTLNGFPAVQYIIYRPDIVTQTIYTDLLY